MSRNNTLIYKHLVEDFRYKVPVVGLGTHNFYLIHSSALICIVCSFVSVVATLVVSFRSKSARTFFKSWSKCERFVVYLAVCDGFFNLVHFMDHFHMLTAKDHVHPIELCEYYGFIMFMFISAQMLLVSLIAINAFALIKFDKNIDLGKCDWKLLSLTFGFPFVECLGITIADEMGPTGVSCGVAGEISLLFLSTIPVLTVLTLNSFLYSLTWYKIRTETKKLAVTIGNKDDRKALQAARTMSLFVFAFIIQWWAAAVYGAWKQVDGNVPLGVIVPAVTFSNIGGILNGIVYFIMRRNRQRQIIPKTTVITVKNRKT
ncbi:uncharacterized protein LOC133182554 [Saccostrea echinata]|uniref:uncharacterized protein LOC133182554 n=1 Tax=Saccostrea echinata TaxID=191078 RepID=UPI002A7F3D13|nr:uncharacterized protein LOC133182554 [Saccostrea echinata]